MVPQKDPELQTRWAKLEKEIENFRRYYFIRRRMNYITYAILVISGLGISIAIAIAGMLDQGLYAAILGVCVGFVQGILQVFPMGEKAEFYRMIVAESDNLIADLNYQTPGDSVFQTILDEFETLRSHAATALPRGQGMDMVRKMYDDLASLRQPA